MQTLLPLDLPPRGGLCPQVEKHGVVYTKAWVIDLILDLVGFTPDQPLFQRLIVEPSAGDGAFLGRIVARLAESCQHHGVPLRQCENAIVGYELDEASAQRGRAVVKDVLCGHGVNPSEADHLSKTWIRTGD